MDTSDAHRVGVRQLVASSINCISRVYITCLYLQECMHVASFINCIIPCLQKLYNYFKIPITALFTMS